MIVFAGIVPHSPLLIPSIGKEHREKLDQTLKAFEAVEQALYLSKPDTILMISPHASLYPDAFSGNVASSFKGSLKEFGDHSTSLEAKVDFLILDHIHRLMREENMPFTLTSSEELDYGFTVPLLMLTSHLQNWKLIPLSVSMLGVDKHLEFGKQLKRVIHAEQTRIAVIASADLSHHVNQQSPQGATPEGQEFDRLVRQHFNALSGEGLVKMKPEITEKAGQCGLKPLTMMLGALDGMNGKAKELCYEAPFGVGYLTGLIDLA